MIEVVPITQFLKGCVAYSFFTCAQPQKPTSVIPRHKPTAIPSSFVCTMRAAGPLALLLLVACAVGKEDLVPNLAFVASKCYRRNQICCYKYKQIGKFCKQNLCTRKTYCGRFKGKYCSKWKAIRTCRVRCYYRMRPHYQCTPMELKLVAGYVHPKEHLEFIPKPPVVRHMN